MCVAFTKHLTIIPFNLTFILTRYCLNTLFHHVLPLKFTSVTGPVHPVYEAVVAGLIYSAILKDMSIKQLLTICLKKYFALQLHF